VLVLARSRTGIRFPFTSRHRSSCSLCAARNFCRPPASSVCLAGAFGLPCDLRMINPSKARYSMAPTMAAGARAVYLTARLLTRTLPSHGCCARLLGLVLGLAVDFRLPKPVPSAGYVMCFLVWRSESSPENAGRHAGLCFGVAVLAGMAPPLCRTRSRGSRLRRPMRQYRDAARFSRGSSGGM